MRCPACLQEVLDSASACSNCGTNTVSVPRDRLIPYAVAATPAISRDHGAERFVPGTVLAERYRVIALAGRGGMGEVYRGTDLLLNAPVALKFLPERATNDHDALSRLYSEVRLAHQVSHPNVCRVYDIFRAGLLCFISMEYIDGEDLRSLLRRIRRVPADRAVEIARSLCEGLQAAHDKGILHRDLKPSNIMIDAQGQVRIADFGLAGIPGEFDEGSQSGTPPYMAPEQLAGSGVSVRSDLYSLGVVLYEMFTGRRAFEGRTLSEVRKLQQIRPIPPRALVPDLDPVVEQIILACLEVNPLHRPASAGAVAAALGGGDRLAATVALGRTPPPEILAATSDRESLRLRAAGFLLAGIFGGLAAFVVVAESTTSSFGIPLARSPEVLAYEASTKIRRLGYTEIPADTAYGFFQLRDDARRSGRRTFWYRQSPAPMEVLGFRTPASVGYFDPPGRSPGMIGMTLDGSGSVRSFYAVPTQKLRPVGAPLDTQAAWRTLFEQAGLDIASLSEAQPQSISPVAFDTQRAWAGTSSGKRVRVEAALWRGLPVYLDIAAVPIEAEPVPQQTVTRGSSAARIIIILIFVSSVVVAPLLARYHVAMHRADTRGAARIATVVFCAELAAWVLGTSHTPTFRETYLMTVGLGRALYSAALTAVMYLALEPFVRRHWPRSLISWTRVLSGRVYDPLVGTHVLIGVALAIGVSALARVGMALNGGRDLSTTLGQPSVLALLGGRHMAAQFPFYISDVLVKCMTVLFLVFLFKVLLRNTGLTVAAATLLMTAAFAGTGTGDPVIRAALVLTGTALMMTGLARFGFLSFVVASLATAVLTEFPVTYRFSAWYSTASFTALAVVVALAVFGFFAATVNTRRTAGSLLAVGQ